MSEADKVFAGSIPENYDRHMVPLDLRELRAGHVRTRRRTGAESRAGNRGRQRRGHARSGADPLPDASYVVTDLNQPMLDYAESKTRPDSRIIWQKADAQALPFEDAAFDLVCCQFGVMFFPDRPSGYREARRVLGPAAFPVQRLGSHRGERVRRRRHRRPCDVLSGRPSPLPGPHAPRLSRHRADPQRSGEGGLYRRDDRDQGRRKAAPPLPAMSRWPIAREPRCATRSKRGAGPAEAATDHAASVIAVRHGSGEISAKIQAHIILAPEV